MKKNKNITTIGFRRFVKDEGIYLPSKWTADFTKSSVKRYGNNLYLLSKLTKTERLILDYVTENASSENDFDSNIRYRKRITLFFEKNCKTLIKDSAIKHSFRTLKKLGILIAFKSRGSYCINPNFYFPGSDKKRRELLKSMLEDAYTSPEMYDPKSLAILL